MNVEPDEDARRETRDARGASFAPFCFLDAACFGSEDPRLAAACKSTPNTPRSSPLIAD